jgi:tight adherence protein C
MTTAAIGVLVAVAVGVIVWATLDVVFSEQRAVSRRLQGLSQAERSYAGEVEPLSRPFRQRVLGSAGASTSSAARRLVPSEYRRRLEARTRMANHPGGVDADSMIALKVLGILAGGALGAGLAYLFWGTSAAAILGGGMFALLGWWLPSAWLNGQITRRQNEIRRELPDMLDMLMIAVEAGLGFDAAVAKYVANRSGALADEFAIELSEVQAGLTRREALRKLAERNDVFELSTFCMAMVQADVFGVSIGKVLRTQAAEMRLKRRQHAEEVAQKLPAKMVFPLVLCILPATMVVLIAPAAILISRIFGAGG